MKIRMLFALLVGAAMLCAPAFGQNTNMNRRACREADWRAVGELDGGFGLGSSALENRTKRCARHDVVPDAALYGDGHATGLTRFCTPTGALDAGIEDVGEVSQCPANEAVATAHRAGLAFARAKSGADSQRRTYESQVSQSNWARSRINQLISEHNAATDPALRAKRQEQIARERRSLQSTELMIPFYRQRADEAQSKLDDAAAVVRALRAEIQAQSFRGQLGGPAAGAVTPAAGAEATAGPAQPSGAAQKAEPK
jgi:hypothetical protein